MCSFAPPLRAEESGAGENGTTPAAAKRPKIQELLKLPAFTNSAGMVMVKLSENLWAGKFPVTQAEYQEVTNEDPSQFKGEQNPVDSVSWNDASRFCSLLNQREAKERMLAPGFYYSLPTQVQWEQLMDSADLTNAVTSVGATRKGTAPVGSLGANRLGLHDMRGNVWAWCLDPQDKPYRVLRGGAWNVSLEINLRPEFRWYSNGPDDRKSSYGFRCIMQSR